VSIRHFHLQVTGPDLISGARAQWRGALCTSEEIANAEAKIEAECGKGKRTVAVNACALECFGTAKH
jgi:hypothetical protein